MSNETTRIFVPDGGNDAMTMAALMNNGGGFGGGWNSPIWAIVFLAALQNGGFFGGGNNGNRCQLSQIQEQLQTIQGNNSLMSAIQGGTNEVRSLANTLNCDFNAVQGAINAVQSSICSVGNQVGMTSAQIVNAIQNGNMQLANTLQSCCCDVRQDVTKMGYENQINNLQQSQLIQNGFCQIGFDAAQNANSIKQAIIDQTLTVTNKLDQQDKDRMQREITALTADNASLRARAERQAELAPIYQQLNDIACKQPKTESVYAPSVVGVPACTAFNYGLYGGFPFSAQQGRGSIWS